MRKASVSRGGSVRAAASHSGRFRAAAGALAVLFARSYKQAGEIHRAMLARGFQGRFHPLASPHFHAADIVFLVLASAAPVMLRVATERLT